MGEQKKPETAKQWAELLKAEWEERAGSHYRRFFIASHPDWDDAAAWRRQARQDVEFLLQGLTEKWLRRAEVLEIGCGIGRLLPELLGRVGGYTGIDVSPALIAEAIETYSAVPGVRFFESSGHDLPSAVGDRQYPLIISPAVFIHCPAGIIRSLVQSAIPLLAHDGRLRFQVLADPDDLEGIIAPPATTGAAPEPAAEESLSKIVRDTTAELRDAGLSHLVDQRSYQGHRFRYAEARELLESVLPDGGQLNLLRLDRAFIYAELIQRGDGAGGGQ